MNTAIKTENQFDVAARISSDADQQAAKDGLVGLEIPSFALGYLKSKLAIAIKLGGLSYSELQSCAKESPITFLKPISAEAFYSDVMYVVIKKLESGEYWCQGFKGEDWRNPAKMNPIGSTKQTLGECKPVASDFEAKNRWIHYFCGRRSNVGCNYITGSLLDVEGCIANLIQAKNISPNN